MDNGTNSTAAMMGLMMATLADNLREQADRLAALDNVEHGDPVAVLAAQMAPPFAEEMTALADKVQQAGKTATGEALADMADAWHSLAARRALPILREFEGIDRSEGGDARAMVADAAAFVLLASEQMPGAGGSQ